MAAEACRRSRRRGGGGGCLRRGARAAATAWGGPGGGNALAKDFTEQPVYGGAVLSDRREKGRRARSYCFSEGKRKRRRPAFAGGAGSRVARGGRGRTRTSRVCALWYETYPRRRACTGGWTRTGRFCTWGRRRTCGRGPAGTSVRAFCRRPRGTGGASRARAPPDAVLTPGGERDALALEARLIQRIKPPPNVLLKHAPRPDAARIVATLDDPVALRASSWSTPRIAPSRRALKRKTRILRRGVRARVPTAAAVLRRAGAGAGRFPARIRRHRRSGIARDGRRRAERPFEVARGSDADGVDGVAVSKRLPKRELADALLAASLARGRAPRSLRPRARAGPARARVPRQARRHRGARAAERKREPRRRRAGRRRRRGRGGPLRTRAATRRRRRRDSRGGGAGRVGARRALRSAAGGGAGGGERR